jgi:hypothetical protein
VSVPSALEAPDADQSEIVLDPDATLYIRSLVAPIVPQDVWIDGVMREHLPAATQLKPITVEATTSAHGWPVVFAHYEAFDVAGRKLEERAGAFYRIVHNNAEVMVRLRNGVRFADRATTLKPLLLSGEVKWPRYETGSVASLLGPGP